MKNNNFKKLIAVATLLGFATRAHAYDDELTLMIQKGFAATKTITCGTASAFLFGVSARLSRSSKIQDVSAIGKFFKGAHRGTALVTLGLGAVCAVPAITGAYDLMNLKFRLWNLRNNRGF